MYHDRELKEDFSLKEEEAQREGRKKKQVLLSGYEKCTQIFV
jgi:hypothetical protein